MILVFSITNFFIFYRRVPNDVVRSDDRDNKSVTSANDDYKEVSDVDDRISSENRSRNNVPASKKPKKNKNAKGEHSLSGATPVEIEKDSQFVNKLWKILFANVYRSIDELYEFCEEAGDEVKFAEILVLLERSSKDFHKLVERIEEQKKCYGVEGPSSISWEVRKPTKSSSISSRLLAQVTQVMNGNFCILPERF